jgi:hypothetical protein
MDSASRRTVQTALYAIAVVLLVIYFGRDFWEWATWSEEKDAVDLGIVRIGARPPFPNEPRHVLLGLITPIVLFAYGTILGRGGRRA